MPIENPNDIELWSMKNARAMAWAYLEDIKRVRIDEATGRATIGPLTSDEYNAMIDAALDGFINSVHSANERAMKEMREATEAVNKILHLP